MFTLRCALMALVSMASVGCGDHPTGPTPTVETVRIEGNTGGLCVPQAHFWAMWTATVTDGRRHAIEVTAYRDPAPGCASTRKSPMPIHGYFAADPPKEVTFLLHHGQQCGHVEFVMTVDGQFRASTLVDVGAQCEGGE